MVLVGPSTNVDMTETLAQDKAGGDHNEQHGTLYSATAVCRLIRPSERMRVFSGVLRAGLAAVIAVVMISCQTRRTY